MERRQRLTYATEMSMCRKHGLSVAKNTGFMSIQDVEGTFGVKDLVEIFDKSPKTIYRWNNESKEAIDQGKKPFFPVAIFTGGRKRHLRWSRSAIREFLDSQGGGTPKPSPKPLSSKDRQVRHAKAMEVLATLGVKIVDAK